MKIKSRELKRENEKEATESTILIWLFAFCALEHGISSELLENRHNQVHLYSSGFCSSNKTIE